MSYLLPQTPSTTMMKIGARLEETRSYLRRVELGSDAKTQKLRAWQEQWFGFLAEPILETLIFTLNQRFGQYAEALTVLKSWLQAGLEPADFKMLTHLHIQISDPYYRWATGVFFRERYQEGFDEISSYVLAQALEKEFSEQLSAPSYRRLAQGILATARDLGLLSGSQKKKFAWPLVTPEALGYQLYFLHRFGFAWAQLPESPFMQAIFPDAASLRRLLMAGQHKGWWDFHWDQGLFSLNLHYKDLPDWFEEVMS